VLTVSSLAELEEILPREEIELEIRGRLAFILHQLYASRAEAPEKQDPMALMAIGIGTANLLGQEVFSRLTGDYDEILFEPGQQSRLVLQRRLRPQTI